MSELNIAFVTSEAVPFAKTGGLADVSGALPTYLAKAGNKVKIFMPKYQQVIRGYYDLERVDGDLHCIIGEKKYEGALFKLPNGNENIEFYFIENDYFFNRPELYRDPETNNDYTDNDERFIFFCHGVLQALKALRWQTDIIHCNDWQTALIPVYLRSTYKDDPFYIDSKSVFSIHNLGYQGKFPADTFAKLKLDESLFYSTGPLEFWGDVNFMKGATHFADQVTTVSPTYAREIQGSDEYGKGLQDVLKERSAKLTGILNGVDYETWSPKTDSLIPYRYFPANRSGKKRNKLELLHQSGLPVRMEQPLIGMISRLDAQKGFDLLEEIMDNIMGMNLQFVLLGTGDKKYHQFFIDIQKKYPDRFKAFLQFDNSLAHLIEAGADIFLMPSRYEPCGLNQMYSLKYGTIPIVRKTGGLADTVEDFNEKTGEGTGFVFDKYDSTKLLVSIIRACELFGKKRIWNKIVKQAMEKDYSWSRSAETYVELYRKTISNRS